MVRCQIDLTRGGWHPRARWANIRPWLEDASGRVGPPPGPLASIPAGGGRGGAGVSRGQGPEITASRLESKTRAHGTPRKKSQPLVFKSKPGLMGPPDDSVEPMTFLVALLVWVLVLGLVFSLALYAIRQLPFPSPFPQVATAILCLIVILVIISFMTGQVAMPGLVHR